jgi:hypothetical protein
MRRWICLVFSLSLVVLSSASAQTTALDTNFRQAALTLANARYTSAIGPQLPLYNGQEYNFYNPAQFKGSAYFMETLLTPGTVYYDGAEYRGVQLLYDLYTDQLITVMPDQYTKFTLIGDRVQYFDLLEHHFIYVNVDSLANTVIKTGYYEELYHGRSEALSKRYKNVQNYQSTTGAQEAYNYFTDTKEEFFIRKDVSYHHVTSQGELLNLLKDHKKQLQQYIKTNKLKFNKTPAASLAAIAAYYDHITN